MLELTFRESTSLALELGWMLVLEQWVLILTTPVESFNT